MRDSVNGGKELKKRYWPVLAAIGLANQAEPFNPLEVDKWVCMLQFWFRGTAVERWSLTGELSLSCARPGNSWRVTTYVGKPSAIGQPTRPTQPFILSGSINE